MLGTVRERGSGWGFLASSLRARVSREAISFAPDPTSVAVARALARSVSGRARLLPFLSALDSVPALAALSCLARLSAVRPRDRSPTPSGCASGRPFPVSWQLRMSPSGIIRHSRWFWRGALLLGSRYINIFGTYSHRLLLRCSRISTHNHHTSAFLHVSLRRPRLASHSLSRSPSS